MTKKQAYRKYISTLIRNLPVKQQLVLGLYYCEDLSFTEIGQILDITPEEAVTLFVQGATSCLGSVHHNPSLSH